MIIPKHNPKCILFALGGTPTQPKDSGMSRSCKQAHANAIKTVNQIYWLSFVLYTYSKVEMAL